jgi:hypothetical protein
MGFLVAAPATAVAAHEPRGLFRAETVVTGSVLLFPGVICMSPSSAMRGWKQEYTPRTAVEPSTQPTDVAEDRPYMTPGLELRSLPWVFRVALARCQLP